MKEMSGEVIKRAIRIDKVGSNIGQLIIPDPLDHL